ncbi:MAG: hypothetical protein AMXMBFR64_59270 [Myxococcales bacterium]
MKLFAFLGAIVMGAALGCLSPDPATGETPNPATGETPNPTSGETANPTSGESPSTAIGETSAAPQVTTPPAAAPAAPGDPLADIFGMAPVPAAPTLLVAAGDPLPPAGGSEVGPPQPDGGAVELNVGLSHPKVLAGGHRTVWLAVGIQAAEARPANRLPLNLALVIDRSGSMEGRKLKDAKAAAHGLVALLSSDDRAALVTYSSSTRADVPSTLMGDGARAAFTRAIDRMRASGSTFLTGGLFEGRAQVQQHARRSQVNRVLLLSDGIANVGITDPTWLAGQARQMSQQGVLISTIGVGNDYNEDLMTAVADYGGGAYYYVRDSRDLASVVEREAQLMASTVAQRMTLELELPTGVVLENLFGYTYTREGNTVAVPLAEAFAGQGRNVLVQLRVPAVEQGPLPVARVRLSYEDVTGQEPLRFDRTVTLDAEATRDAWAVEDAVDRDVLARLQQIRIAQALNEAATAVSRGDRAGARRVLSTAREEAVKANQAYGSSKLDNSIGVLGGVMDEMERAGGAPAAAPALMKRAKASSYEMTK